MQNYLEIYSTSRAIRLTKESYLNSNIFLPKMLTISEFESRAVTLGEKSLIPNLKRALYLQEASRFDGFNLVKKDINLIKFYSNAKDFFRFFEEISAEGVEIKELYLSDTYAEFDRDLELLEKLLNRYKNLIENDGYIDKIFIPKEYKINLNFINSFDGFILHLDGYLTKFELELFSKIAKLKPFIIKLRTTPFNKKVIDSFKNLDISLDENSFIEFNLSKNEILKSKRQNLKIDAEVIEVSEHLEQIAIAIAKIEEFVQSGIKPENIVLIVPDESIVATLKSFDTIKNFNFAMGISYKDDISFKILEQISKYLSGDEIAKEFLVHNSIDLEKIPNSKMSFEEFFNSLKNLNIPLYKEEDFQKALDSVNLRETFYKFKYIFQKSEFEFKYWLFLWLNELKEHSLDDVAGGKVTVMGLLESRGVEFEGVVIIDFNDGVVPSKSNKDRFLNTAVRKAANLPTIADRENLQKHYYAKLLDSAKRAAIIYSTSDNAQASKFLYELNLNKINRYKTPLNLLFDLKSSYNRYSHLKDEEIKFNPLEFIWSPQSLKAFLECKRKFFYRYIKKITEPQSSDLNDGAILHSILAKVIKPNAVFNDKESLKEAIQKEIDLYTKDNIELIYKKPLWIDMLDGFINRQIEHFNKGWVVKSCEFSVSGNIEGLKFSGRVDRLDKKDDFYLIIDYKSGSIAKANLKDSEKLEDFQMSIYSKLLDLPNMDFMFIEILSDGKETYLDSVQDKEDKLIEHINYIKSLKSFKTEQTQDLQKCRFCPYQLLCHRGEYL